MSGGYTYTYKVTVTSGSVSSQATISFQVTTEAIQAIINRQNGDHSKENNLQLSAGNSFDPNSNETQLSFKWTCVACDLATARLLQAGDDQPDYAIEKARLKPGLLKIQCKVSDSANADNSTTKEV
jgi:hypothetical protein